MKKNNKIALPFLFIGVGVLGFSIFLLRLADFGTDPFTTMNLGISSFLGGSFGHLQLIVNIILAVLVAFVSLKYIGIGTIVNMVFVGYVSDFFMKLFTTIYGGSLSLFMRIILLIIGIIVCGLGVTMYMHSDMGVAPYDAIPDIIEMKTGKRVSFQVARVGLDILTVLIGFLFGATVGIGTVITAFFMGPLIQFFRTFLEEHLNIYINPNTQNL